MKRILLMDDSEIFLAVARAALESAGYDVVCASDLAELARVREQGGALSLVLMDVQMPEVFGDDVAFTLRHSYGFTAPIYLLSGLDEKDLADRVQWAQIEGFISKKVGIDGIVSRVQQILSVD